MNRFHSVATLGPASWESPRALIDAGATALRINGSHASIDVVRDALGRLARQDAPIRIVIDLQGAMRLGCLPDRAVREGERGIFALEPRSPGEVPLPHHELFDQIGQGDTLGIDDDRLRLRVMETASGVLTAEAMGAGVLRARKGVNLIEHPVCLSGLIPSDRLLCRLAAGYPHAACAVSFITDGHEAAWVREAAPSCPVIGKVEHSEALEHLDEVDASVDEVWICRGDLGAQVGIGALARWMSRIEPSALRHPVLVAGQVLEHLTAHAAPTRSEACHLFDLQARGYAGIVLSDETAIGGDPVRAVRTARWLIDMFSG